MDRYQNYQTLALYEPNFNTPDDFQFAETILATVTLDEIEVCGKVLTGQVIAKMLYDENAYENDQDYLYPVTVADIRLLEWIDSEGHDHSVIELEITTEDVLVAMKALADRFNCYFNFKNVREI